MGSLFSTRRVHVHVILRILVTTEPHAYKASTQRTLTISVMALPGILQLVRVRYWWIQNGNFTIFLDFLRVHANYLRHTALLYPQSYMHKYLPKCRFARHLQWWGKYVSFRQRRMSQLQSNLEKTSLNIPSHSQVIMLFIWPSRKTVEVLRPWGVKAMQPVRCL